MSIADRRVLITGTTGLIGGELLRTLLDTEVDQIWTLVRADSQAEADARLVERFLRSGHDPDLLTTGRVHAVPGDLTEPGLGIGPQDRRNLCAAIDLVLHSAAETSFIRDENCRRINVDGTRHLLELSLACQARPRFVHLSTATVCGMLTHRCVSESQPCDPAGDHHNEYTRSKARAEQLVRESGLDYVIVRPSITVSAGIDDLGFARAMLWWLPLLGRLEAVPVDRRGRIDVVPVQFVRDRIIDLLECDSLAYDCYHLSAGRQHGTDIGEMAVYLDAHYGRSEPLLLVPPTEWSRELHRRYICTPDQRKTFAALRHYLPFLNMDVLYDTARLRSELGDEACEVPHIKYYLPGLLDLMTVPDPAEA